MAELTFREQLFGLLQDKSLKLFDPDLANLIGMGNGGIDNITSPDQILPRFSDDQLRTIVIDNNPDKLAADQLRQALSQEGRLSVIVTESTRRAFDALVAEHATSPTPSPTGTATINSDSSEPAKAATVLTGEEAVKLSQGQLDAALATANARQVTGEPINSGEPRTLDVHGVKVQTILPDTEFGADKVAILERSTPESAARFLAETETEYAKRHSQNGVISPREIERNTNSRQEALEEAFRSGDAHRDLTASVKAGKYVPVVADGVEAESKPKQPLTLNELQDAVQKEIQDGRAAALLTNDDRARIKMGRIEVDVNLKAMEHARDAGLKGFEEPTSFSDYQEKAGRLEPELQEAKKQIPTKLAEAERFNATKMMAKLTERLEAAEAGLNEIEQFAQKKPQLEAAVRKGLDAARIRSEQTLEQLTIVDDSPAAAGGRGTLLSGQSSSKPLASAHTGAVVDAANAPIMAPEPTLSTGGAQPKVHAHHADAPAAPQLADGQTRNVAQGKPAPANDVNPRPVQADVRRVDAGHAPAANDSHVPETAVKSPAGKTAIPANVKAQVKAVGGGLAVGGVASALTATAQVGIDAAVHGRAPTLEDAKTVAAAAATVIPGVATLLAPAGKEKKITGEVEAVTVSTVATTTTLGSAALGIGAVPGALAGVGLSALYNEGRRLQEGCLNGELACGPIANAALGAYEAAKGAFSKGAVSGGRDVEAHSAPQTISASQTEVKARERH